jgi:prepilin-type N-terminal cleavage/methylation domain-containing protein
MMKDQMGFTLVEVLVSLAILGVTGVYFLNALGTASRGSFIIDERETANNLAESQMEYIKNQSYASSYVPAPISGDYANYSANVSVSVLGGRDGNIQKITIVIKHQDKEVIRLEGYKVN